MAKKRKYINKNHHSHKKKQISESKEPVKKKLNGVLDKGWKRVAALLLILGGIASFIAIQNEWLKSSKKKFEEQTTESGSLNPPKLNYSNSQYSQISNDGFKFFIPRIPPNFDSKTNKRFPPIIGLHVIDFNINNPIYVDCGNRIFYLTPQYFHKGVDILKTLGDSCSNTSLILGLKGDRLYISTEFKRLQNEETMGIIEYNHWTLFKENILTYRYNDTMLEVRDKQNKIAFSIKYGQTSMMRTKKGPPFNGVIIRGYFLGDTSLTVINSQPGFFRGCFLKSDPNWKQKAAVEISKIKSLWNN
ncbi:hypothetical protein HDF24_15505 [Mucilaginibacter sp. X4EP1]|uniref:hypothetical protein n=1 Tax=Mucilaginibacter sp. X4EP1 TaxID=2723092 RepID=UPI0021685AD0|nr:hypothetical protein [Mucilaginibacter sp. X4EP1]MCS3815295.1 hypothetical protein [Mucilaginibacter sp. X4EP1]